MEVFCEGYSRRDQGRRGSCANFAVLAAYEGNNAIRNNTVVDGSEQRLLSCAPANCTGARSTDIAQYMVTTGTSTEAAYPYTATNSACNAATTTPFRAITRDFVGANIANPAVRELKNALCTYGPITTVVRATPTFMAYSSGIFNEASNQEVDHSVTIVGWDNSNGGYWIIKNSYGTGWGEDGFGRIAWGSNGIGQWSHWIQAPLSALNINPREWRRILKKRRIPVTNRFIRRL
ncbi:MAG: C1 family peptidase [Pseudomonadota bacterium]|nr:C1 family peptidase [Pseudomonadota bacterium]